ncbi:MAG TPA: hypothetical protein DCZ92_12285 [Elusimicrobia bacterium]|nr:MAG: hypothetical protein A2016_00965 [Elusimicrobia bacterium GWF2_62_30]HBA61567.1 hypothetical protein [Elusimicrobiota bacterium]
MKYTGLFFRLTLREVFRFPMFYLATIVSGAVMFMLLGRMGGVFDIQAVADLAAGQLVYVLLSLGMLLIFMCAMPVFINEKQQKILPVLMYSPANFREILLGKSLALVFAAIVSSLASFTGPLLSHPALLRAMAAPGIAAALALIFATLLVFTLIIGMLLLCAPDIKVLYPALFFLNYIPMEAQKRGKLYMEAHGIGGINWLYLLSLGVLALIAAGVYRLYFSKARMTA